MIRNEMKEEMKRIKEKKRRKIVLVSKDMEEEMRIGESI